MQKMTFVASLVQRKNSGQVLTQEGPQLSGRYGDQGTDRVVCARALEHLLIAYGSL